MAEAHTNSYYAATRNRDTSHPALTESIDTDICICGAGFTGVATALTLAERGYSVVVLEQNRISWGASGRNGGQIIGGFGGADLIVKRLGQQVADVVWDIGWRGNDIIRDWVKKYGIDCDLKWGYIDLALKPRHMESLRKYFDELLERGFRDDVRLVEKEDMGSVIDSDAYLGGVINNRNGHLHPLNLCIGEARAAEGLGVQFFEDSEVLGIEHGVRPLVKTARGQVRASTVVLAGNAYQNLELKRLSGLVFPAGSYIIARRPFPGCS